LISRSISVYLVVKLDAVAVLGVEPCLGGGLFCGVFVGSAIFKIENSIQMVEGSCVAAAKDT
jgi:hypothetical protein